MTIPNKCAGCNRTFKHPRRSISKNFGYYVCIRCSRRKNMPMIGHESKVKWKAEEKLKRNKSRGWLTWPEQQVLWKEYMSRGLNEYEAKAKIRSLKATLSRNYWQNFNENATKPKEVKFKVPEGRKK